MKRLQSSLGLSELKESVRNEHRLHSAGRDVWGAGRRSRQPVAMCDITAMLLKGPARHLLRQRPVLKRTGQNRDSNVILIFIFWSALFSNKDGFFISSSSRSPPAPHHHYGNAARGTAVTTATRCSGEDLICVSTSDLANHVRLGRDYRTGWPMTDERLGNMSENSQLHTFFLKLDAKGIITIFLLLIY